MDAEIKISIVEHFKIVNDPRRSPLHSLHEILTIIICAVICGANDIVGIVTWAEQRESWLNKILDLPYGIPSHDTIGRVLSIISPKEFEESFINWTNAVFKKTNGDIVPIDGKLLRGSYDKSSGISAINIVGAYSTANSVLLGHVKTDSKSNEITAIPKLLEMLDINGCIITIDAIGCQTKIAKQISDKNGDYVLAVKDNQPTLHQEIQTKFCNEEDIEYYETKEKSHGREETRKYGLINDVENVSKAKDFKSCSAVGFVESTRTLNGETSVETRCFILSFVTTAMFFAKCIRKHWVIENSAHYILDVAFKEDHSRIRKDHTPANMSTIRRASLNMIKQEKTAKVGVNNKRLMASSNLKYLEKVIGVS